MAEPGAPRPSAPAPLAKYWTDEPLQIDPMELDGARTAIYIAEIADKRIAELEATVEAADLLIEKLHADEVRALEATVATLQWELVRVQSIEIGNRHAADDDSVDADEIITDLRATVATLTAERDDLLAERTAEIMAGQAAVRVGGVSPRAEEIDNGNIFVFCDYVDTSQPAAPLGCVRGVGHNGPHAFAVGYGMKAITPIQLRAEAQLREKE